MTVTVYTKPDCRQCDATKRYLSERDVSFEVESLEDAANLAAAKALGHLGAPVVVFAPDGAGSEVSWSGFRPDMLDVVAARFAAQVAIFDRPGAAARIGKTERTLRRWEERGEITFTLGRIRESDLLDADKRMRSRRGRPRKDAYVRR